MHGCIVKLYSALEPLQSPAATTGGEQELTPKGVDTPRKSIDCIVIVGAQNSDVTLAMDFWRVLFNDEEFDFDRKMYFNKAVCREVSCTKLIPDHSGYEQLLILFNQQGRGVVLAGFT